MKLSLQDIQKVAITPITPSIEDSSNDKESIASVGDNHNLRCKHCWYEWTESWQQVSIR
jgi:hypothetical protein